jgi:hypothetical protein
VCDFRTTLFRSRIHESTITPRDDWGLIKRELTNSGRRAPRAPATATLPAAGTVSVARPKGGSFETIDKIYRAIEIIDFLYRAE